MKLLISTYACAPNHGSEQAVGWNWTTEAHRLGHQVWALASPVNRAAIEAACRADPELAGIHWTFPDIGIWPLQPGVEPVWERTYNLLWQRKALRLARALHRTVGFDAVHHLTWGGVRAPTFLGALGAPLIVGPIGGGETSPGLLRDGFTFKAKVIEGIRDLSNATIAANPLVHGGLADASVIFVKTPDTRQLLTRSMQRKSMTFLEVSLQPAQIGAPRRARQGPPRLLYAGRLLYWKGAHIALQAFAQLALRMPDTRLTLVGKGPESGRLKAQAAAMNLDHKVDFIPWLPQQQLFELYETHDLFVFPSLHDSSGNVVIEALSRGLPVAVTPPQWRRPWPRRCIGCSLRPSALLRCRKAPSLALETSFCPTGSPPSIGRRRMPSPRRLVQHACILSHEAPERRLGVRLHVKTGT